jgi:Fur family ferric uptake transcriptional regulator
VSRRTPQREIIKATIDDANRPLAPRELLELAQIQVPTLSLATVYRTLNLLLEDGFVIEVHLPGESVRYERAGRGHHHHFHCQQCGRAFDLTACPGDAISRMAPPGFRVASHDITLFGVCRDCLEGVASMA